MEVPPAASSPLVFSICCCSSKGWWDELTSLAGLTGLGKEFSILCFSGTQAIPQGSSCV